jgi:SHS2 domain-containing protein
MYAYFSEPAYESRLSFALDAGNSADGLSGAFSLASQLGFGMGGGGSLFDGDNIIEIMKSRRIIESVLLSADTVKRNPITLVDQYLDYSGLRKKYDNLERTKNIHFPVGTPKISLSYLQDSILNIVYQKMVKENINPSRPDKKLSIYELKVSTPNERLTKIFTDRLIEASGAYYTEITSKKEKETVDALEQRVDSMQKKVGVSLVSKAVTLDANINPAFSVAQTNPQMQQYNILAYGEAYKELFKNLELAKYQYIKKIPLLQIIDHADYPMERIKKSRLKYFIYFAFIAVMITAILLYKRNSNNL